MCEVALGSFYQSQTTPQVITTCTIPRSVSWRSQPKTCISLATSPPSWHPLLNMSQRRQDRNLTFQQTGSSFWSTSCKSIKSSTRSPMCKSSRPSLHSQHERSRAFGARPSLSPLVGLSLTNRIERSLIIPHALTTTSLKLAVRIKLTSAVRTISPASAFLAPRICSQVVPALHMDQSILTVSKELASVVHK